MLKIYGAGLNAHGQIDKRIKSDCHTFTQIWKEDLKTTSDATVLFTGWSEIARAFPHYLIHLNRSLIPVVVTKDTHLYLLGSSDTFLTSTSGIKAVFGDHNGILGYFDNEGRISLSRAPASSHTKHLVEPETSRRFSHITVADNGHIAAVSQDDEAVIHEFTSMAAFKSYLEAPPKKVGSEYHDDALSGTDHVIHQLGHNITQLVSNTASFCALDVDGRVYTWGDNRYGTLRRSGLSSSPCPVEHLGDADDGPRVTKIVSGGWMTGAIRDDGVAFLWGGQMPGTEPRRGLLEGEGGYLETTVEIEGPEGVLDVLDMAIGEGFVVVVCEAGRLFGVGENGNGQLGEGRKRNYYEEWVEILERGVVNVWAGPKTVYVRVNDDYDQS